MQHRTFAAGIVLAQKDLMSVSGPIGLETMMDAVEAAVSVIPGITGIDICYLGNRAPRPEKVWIRAVEDGDGEAVARGPWNEFLRREVEKYATRAIAELTGPRGRRKAAA